ncbi:MAG TPA: RNA polymerase factor sigma-32, partial [Oceanospirillales bacterium]|nr:RNA polymerase factor sigma-32 [Oceanospirillales bacterium]
MSQGMQAVYAMSPGQNLESYIATVNAIPVLSPDEEKDLAERYHYQGDLEAARQLVMSH